MHSFPLLSEAYVAALLTPHPDLGPAEEDAQKRNHAPREERRPPVAARAEDEDGDLETAPTRPLKLDRLRL